MRKLRSVKVTKTGSRASIWTTLTRATHGMTLINSSTKTSRRSSSTRVYPTYRPARPTSLSSDQKPKSSGKKLASKIGSSRPRMIKRKMNKRKPSRNKHTRMMAQTAMSILSSRQNTSLTSSRISCELKRKLTSSTLKTRMMICSYCSDSRTRPSCR